MARPRAKPGVRRTVESESQPWPKLAQLLDSYRWPIVSVMLLLFGAMAWTATREKAPAYDELAHLTAGYSYWLTGDYRLHPENGILPQRWAALPLLAMGLQFPELTGAAWWQSDVWELGYPFFYTQHNDLLRMLWWARGMIVSLGMVLGGVVYVWSRRLFGPIGAILSLSLYTFSPTMLAHAGLITSDLTASLAFLVSLGTLWMALHWVDARHVIASAVALGALFVAKMSAVLILPVAFLLIVVRLISGRPMIVKFSSTALVTGRVQQLTIIAMLVLVHAAAVMLIIWTAYGFRYTAMRDAEAGRDQMFQGRTIESLTGDDLFGRAVRLANDYHLFPEAYLHGLAFSIERSKTRAAFLNGAYSLNGWPMFFPYSFLVKTPLATLGVVVLAIAVAFAPRSGWPNVAGTRAWFSRARVWRGLYRTAPLTVFLAVYWAAAIATHLNIGHRHILPTYPAMFILCGAAGYWMQDRTKFMAAAVVALLSSLAVATATSYPDYLAYFNRLAGGPSQGYRHLVDSSLDWGQDLPALKRWLDDDLPVSMRDKPVYLSYFGTGSPEWYGIRSTRLPGMPNWRPPNELAVFRPGTYCISATMLQSVYLGHPGKWTAESEIAYRKLRNQVVEMAKIQQVDPDFLKRMETDPSLAAERSKWNKISHLYEQYQFDRLCAYLREREPDAEVGYSILIYYLDEQQLNAALEGPL